jgi:hypothetical protein
MRARSERTPVDTDARIFVARLVRELAAKQARGAAMLSPGTQTWAAAFRSFGETLRKAKGPVKAAAMCRAASERLLETQLEGACFINGLAVARSRSAGFEVLTWEVERHPLLDHGYEGVTVRRYLFLLRRNGIAECGWSKLAHLSWHALARMRERSKVDIFGARGIVALCGVAGLLLRESDKHHNTQINLSLDELICTGVLRVADDAEQRYAFFDVSTVLEPDERTTRKHDQGTAIARAVMAYIAGDDADTDGYADDIAVLPFHSSDFVSRELRARVPASELIGAARAAGE